MAALAAPSISTRTRTRTRTEHPHGHYHGHHHVPPAMSPPHGTKRPADSALDGEQRLTKRFDLLNLDNAHKAARLSLPVPSTSQAAATTTAPPAAPADDVMLVEDTPHRLYIHDLAAELSAIESDDDHPVFLSDIEAHLSKIPRHLLLGPPPKPTAHNQMVLYNVPASLTLPEEHDSVRKAIVEARQRIRDSQASPVTEPQRVLGPATTDPLGAAAADQQEPDAMDLD